MKKTMFFALGMTTLMMGCMSADKETKNTINQEEVMSKLSLEDKAHFVIGVGMKGFSRVLCLALLVLPILSIR